MLVCRFLLQKWYKTNVKGRYAIGRLKIPIMKNTNKGIIMFFITFECLDEYGKSVQMNLLQETLLKQRISNSVINMNGHGLFDDDISKLYTHLGNEGSYSLPEKFFLQMTRRARQIEHLFNPAITRQTDLHYSVILCPHSPEGLATLFGEGHGYGSGKALFPTCTTVYSRVHVNLNIMIDVPPEIGLKCSRLKFRSREDGLSFYSRVRDARFDVYDFKKRSADCNMAIIDGTRSPNEVHADVFETVLRFMR